MTKNIVGAGRGKSKRNGTGVSEALGATSDIGRKLKQYYDDLLSEGVPDRFADLLSRLEQNETNSPDSSKDKA